MRQRWKLATPDDAADVASRLREADKQEGWAALGVDPALYLATGCDYDRTWVIFNAEGENVALAGVSPMDEPDLGQVWMVATDQLLNHQKEFLKHTRAFIDILHEDYPILFNWVDARNEVHIKWLKWCGFTFINRHEKWGPYGIPFYTFIRIKPCVSSSQH
jgi:hypothetical protein